MAGEARHFLLRDEFGLAIMDRAAARRDRLGRAADGADPQALVAHEGQIFALGADAGVELGRLALGQALHAAVDRGEVEVAVERDEQGLAVGGPVVIDDAGEPADPRAFALHLLGFAEFGAGAELLAVDQHAPLAGGGIERPQIVALAVVGAVAEHGQQLAVGAELHPARRGSGERRAGEQALERQRLLGYAGRHGERGLGDGHGGGQHGREAGKDEGMTQGRHLSGMQ